MRISHTVIPDASISLAKLAAAVAAALNPTGTILAFAGTVIPTGYLACDGAAVSRVTYADLFAVLVRSSTVTISQASPGVVTWAAHGLSNSDVVKFSTTGALPAPLVAGTTYYVTGAAAGTFSVAATPGGAAINTTSAGSGVHTAVHTPWGDGDGSTTFNTPDPRGRSFVGAGQGAGLTLRSLGSTDGAESVAAGVSGGHALTADENGIHVHQQSAASYTPDVHGAVTRAAGGGAGESGMAGGPNDGAGAGPVALNTQSSGSGTAHTHTTPAHSLVHPVAAGKFIIKT